MKTFARGTSHSLLVVLLGALLAMAPLAGCDSPGSERENAQPTAPTPGNNIPQRGPLSISPSEVTLTVPAGSTGDGAFFFFQVTGGKPPYVWANDWTQMGLLTPIDEFGLGYFNKAKYGVRNFRGTGDDTITVRDRDGAIVSATFTKSIAGEATTP